ncbi:MAG: hypothetical protein II998_04310 [Clostridia bacterium]|nr:hypothetical protein [Clostridia bacterium]
MKKSLSVFLAFLLLICVQIPAFAEGDDKDVTTGPVLIFEEDFESGALNPKVWRTNTRTKVVTNPHGDNDQNLAAELKNVWEMVEQADGSMKNTCFNSQLNIGANSARYPINHRFIYEYDIMYGSDIDKMTAGPSMYMYKSDNATLYGEGLGTVTYTSNKDGTGVLSASGVSETKQKAIMNVNANQWYKIRLYVNVSENTYSVCVDGVPLVCDDGSSKFEFYNYASDRNKNITPETSAVYAEEGGFASPLFQTSQWHSTNMTYWIDNIKCFTDSLLAFESSVPEKDAEGVNPFEPITVSFKGSVSECSFEIDGESVDESLVENLGNGKFSFTPETPLDWGKECTVKASAKSLYGEEISEEISFTVMEQPDSYVRLVGYYDENGEKLDSLQSGMVSAKLNFMQKVNSKYTYIICLYKEVDGFSELVKATCGEIETTEAQLEKTVSVNVEDAENCYIKVCVLDGLTNRNPYAPSLRYGFTTLK